MKEKLIISVQDAGQARGKRIYFTNKDLRKLKEKYGEDFFLFQEKKLFAQVDFSNEKIIITPLSKVDVEIHKGATSDTDLQYDLIEPIESSEKGNKEFKDSIYELDELNYEPPQLDFYIPMEGTGEKYWIAEVKIRDKLVFYCVAESISLVKKEIKRKAKKYFPGLLDLKNVQINYVNDYLVYSPVPGFIADSAYTQIAEKKINGIEIPAKISIPSDADLTPIVDMKKGTIKDIQIKTRELLAKYEIEAIASEKYILEDIKIISHNGEIIWKVRTNDGMRFFDPINGAEYEKAFKDTKTSTIANV